jgi:hypothetical protein
MEENLKHLDTEEIAQIAEALHNGNSQLVKSNWLEHYSNCSDCRQAIFETIDILDADDSESSSNQISNKVYRLSWFSAASIILLLSFSGWMAIDSWKSKKLLIEVQTQLSKQTPTSILTINTDSLSEKLTMELELKSDSILHLQEQLSDQRGLESLLYADNTSLEAQMKLNLRASSINVVSPLKEAEIEYGENINFQWSEVDSRDFTLLLMNNKNQLILEKEHILTSINLDSKDLLPGTYYWKLWNGSKVLHIGKFKLVKN